MSNKPTNSIAMCNIEASQPSGTTGQRTTDEPQDPQQSTNTNISHTVHQSTQYTSENSMYQYPIDPPPYQSEPETAQENATNATNTTSRSDDDGSLSLWKILAIECTGILIVAGVWTLVLVL